LIVRKTTTKGSLFQTPPAERGDLVLIFGVKAYVFSLVAVSQDL